MLPKTVLAYDTVEEQFAQLRELQRIINMGMARSMDLPVDMPNIMLLGSHVDFRSRGYFLIGLEVDAGDVAYVDWDARKELTSQPVPDEIVDFILSFTNIPREHAVIAYVLLMPTPLLPLDFELSGICSVWGDDLSDRNNFIIPDEDIVDTYNEDSAKRCVTELRMGQLIAIYGVDGQGTIGPPRAGLRHFLTSVHRVLTIGTQVSFNSNPIGSISRSVFNVAVDFAEVAINSIAWWSLFLHNNMLIN